MPSRSHHIAVIVAALFFGRGACLAGPREAAAQDRAAAVFIQNLGSRGLQALQWPEPQRTATFRQLFEANFDIPAIASFALGQYARSFDQQQQSQYMALFREYAVISSIQKLANYSNMEFRVTGSRPYGADTLVMSQAIPAGGRQPVEIDWIVKNYGGRYLVGDVFIEGVSMRIAYRDGFAGIIERNGGRPEALLAVLRQLTDRSRT